MERWQKPNVSESGFRTSPLKAVRHSSLRFYVGTHLAEGKKESPKVLVMVAVVLLAQLCKTSY